MSKYSALIKRASNATAATALALASLTPAIMLGGSAKAAGQMTGRVITMTTSKLSATSQYTLQFTPSAGYKSLAIEFCSNSPLLGNSTCTAVSGLSVSSAAASGWTVANPSADLLTLSQASAQTGAQTIVITSVTNPDTVGTFYARLATYADAVGGTNGADSYLTGTPGTTVDEGGIALSATQDLTINARVQEELTFCVGSTAVTTGDKSAITGRTDCTSNNDSTIDIGVVGTTLTTSPVDSTKTGNGKNGFFFVSTNAVSGAVVTYSSPNGLRVGSVSCPFNNSAINDQCFNSAAGSVSAGTEKFGMRVASITENGVLSSVQLQKGTNYDGASEYTWEAAGTLASSTGPVDKEVAELEFAATTSPTTPTGSYTTSANLVATATF